MNSPGVLTSKVITSAFVTCSAKPAASKFVADVDYEQPVSRKAADRTAANVFFIFLPMPNLEIFFAIGQ
jgi:hypothetical protein